LSQDDSPQSHRITTRSDDEVKNQRYQRPGLSISISLSIPTVLLAIAKGVRWYMVNYI